MRRAGKASPEAIIAERTRSRASDTALSGRPTMVKAGMPGRDLHLDIDGSDLDALERNRRDALDHARPRPGHTLAEPAFRQEHLGNDVGNGSLGP